MLFITQYEKKAWYWYMALWFSFTLACFTYVVGE
jgi:hypothetical protein